MLPRRLLILTLAALPVLTGPRPAAAAALKLVTLEFRPLEYADEAGVAQGAAVEVVREALKRAGHTVTIEVLPWTRALNLTREGKADAIFTAYKTPEREAFLDFGNEVLIPQVISLYVRKGSDLRFSGDLKELRGKTIGTLSTISYGTIFDEARDQLGLKTERTDDLDLNFKKLLAKRLDYAISNRYSAQIAIERLPAAEREQIEELQVPVEVTPSYIAFSKVKKLEKLRDAVDAELKAMKASGRYYEILDGFRVRVPKGKD